VYVREEAPGAWSANAYSFFFVLDSHVSYKPGDMQTALKVAWDNCFARRNEAGTGVYAAQLLEQLLSRDDLELAVLNGFSVNLQDSVIARIIRTSADFLWTHAYLPGYLSLRNFDLLHAPAFIAPVKAPCPVVITIHDVTYLLFPSHFPRWWNAYMKLVMPTTVNSAAAILCGSEHSKRDIVNAYHVRPEIVRVVPYGVDHNRFRPGVPLDDKWGRSLGIRQGYLLHVGALSYRKNIPVLLRAIDRVRSRGKWGDRQLVVAGPEVPGLAGAAEIYACIQQLDLHRSVVLAGRVPNEILPGLYANASLLVMPSLYEGFGFPVLESMSAGTPVIASNNSSLPEITADAAILFPPEDIEALANAIEEIICSRSEAEELRRKGLARARQFSWFHTAKATIEVYRSVAG
jgi:glycosyltransferase involved in cell wall biosynthesis